MNVNTGSKKPRQTRKLCRNFESYLSAHYNAIVVAQ